MPGDILDEAVIANVKHIAATLRSAAPILSSAVAAGQLRIAGAHYGLKYGAVRILD